MKKLIMSSDELLKQKLSFTDDNKLVVEIKGRLYTALYSQVGEYKDDWSWVLTPVEERDGE